ncbi:MAG: Rpn family recombination-promoting nuclease/putative transposase [Prevotellaceae bacterium]|jgi:predicted transposase/invertase (TIGR01784 family)|nr:Rpn family recombination-promoting nuclease/putative transposase [Prevotellaceae bacterium]
MDEDVGKQKIDEELGVFINPKTDFGFHRVFSNQKMMISFLNEVVMPEEKTCGQITSVSYLPSEHFGELEDEHHVIFDTRCRTGEGEDVVVEMQNARPMNFGSRLIFYSTYPIRSQAPPRKRKRKGKNGKKPQKWYYDLKAVYMVAIVNFPMLKGKKTKDIVIDWVRLMSVKTKQCFSDKLNFVIVDLTKFNKEESELKTLQDCWLYTLKHAEKLKERPKKIKNKLFIDLYECILQTNKLTQEEMEIYNKSVIEMKNLGLFTDYAKMEGIEIGRIEGIGIGEKRGIEIGRNEGIGIGRSEGIGIGEKRGIEITQIQTVIAAANKGISLEDISDFTGLSVKQIYKILSNKK